MMKRLYLYTLVIAFWLIGCAEEVTIDSTGYPRIETLKVTDITENGVVFNARVVEMGDKPIINHGFIWESFGFLKSKALGELSSGTFSSLINFGLPRNKELDVKAFVVTSSDSVVGNPVTFVSLGGSAPIIDSFEPLEGNEGDVIIINGFNFSDNISENQVFFGSIPTRATVVSATSDRLEVVVPPPPSFAEEKFQINISIDGKSGSSQDEFTFKSSWTRIPIPEAYFEVVRGIEFEGIAHIIQKGLANQPNRLWKFTPEDHSWELVEKFTGFFNEIGTSTQINEKIALFAEGLKEIGGTLGGIYDLYDPATQSFSKHNIPLINYPGGKDRISFELDNQIYFGLGVEYEPNGDITNPSSQRFRSFDVTSGTSTDIDQFPGASRGHALSFSRGGIGYVGLGNNVSPTNGSTLIFDDIWKYDPITNQWSEGPKFPSKSHIRAEAVNINNRTFVYTQILGGIEIWELVGGSTWNKVNSVSAGVVSFFKPFVIGDIVYLTFEMEVTRATNEFQFYSFDIDKL